MTKPIMKQHLHFLLFIAIFFFTNPLLSQTGPGGVGNNTTNGLWLKADDVNLANGEGVTTWQDASGNANHANQTVSTGRPTFKSVSTFNNYPSIDFDGNNDWLRVEDADILDGTTSINYFTVVKPKGLGSSQSVQAIVSKRNGYNTSNNQYAYTFFFYNNRLTNDITNSDNRYDSSHAFSNNTNYVLSFDFDGGLVENARSSMSKNGNILITAREQSNKVLASSAPLIIGQLNVGDGRYATEELAEIIHFNYKLNIAERTIVHNYLSAKYNTPLVVNNFYTQDNAVNGEFDHHVAGIARISGTAHLDSQGSGIVRVNNPSDLSATNDKYLFWGQNIMGSTYNFNAEIPAEDNAGIIHNHQHLNTIWRVSKSEGAQNLGTVDMTFDISSFPEISGCHSLELVVGSDSYDYSLGTANQYNAIFSSPQSIYPLTVSGGTATASGLDISDGSHFTLRYRKNELIIWNGSSFSGGSGPGGAPSALDANKTLLISSGTATLNANAYVCEIEVSAGAKLNLANDLKLTVQNRIVNNGEIDLFGEAQLVQKHIGETSNSGSGSLKIRQQGTSNLYNYNYWSAPVNRNGLWKVKYLEDNNGVLTFSHQNNANFNTRTLSSKWLYTFYGTQNNYADWRHIGDNRLIVPGIGYTMKGSGNSDSDQEYVFRGTPNNGNYNVGVFSGIEVLTGNPYPSALDATQFIIDNLDVIDGTLYFYEQFETNNTHVLRDYQGGYATLNLMAGVAAGEAAGDTNGGISTKGKPTNNIAVAQGFFVNINAAGNLKFNNAQRVFAKESLDESVFYRESASRANTDTRTKFWLNLTDPLNRTRQIALGYDKNASAGFDKGYDAADNSNYPDTMLWDGADNLLVIQGLNEFNIEDDIPLFIKIKTPGNYTISLSETINFPKNTPVYLKDNLENRFYNLKEKAASISFKGGEYTNRYSIVYQRATLSTGTLETSLNVFVTFDKKTDNLQIFGVNDLNVIDSAHIYSIEGKQVVHIKSLDSNRIDIAHINDGIYILKLEKTSGEIRNIKFVKY
ncbi:T9SS type A sorting domain-containing protein [Bizionia argentinensis JUB59]|uniref:T9SS type A sorting domain-containing protein n=1 Tax=Bizionia argentinensis JUB59 TaxID=1046627 RepID=G2EBN5_9FLAO|nr:T9SS type A sorting domain-containing protein [Bizionia argentinensis]EGV44127.1 T9SS type A sorting domain-containing protein [Bizionia argentinensis JUB59]